MPTFSAPAPLVLTPLTGCLASSSAQTLHNPGAIFTLSASALLICAATSSPSLSMSVMSLSFFSAQNKKSDREVAGQLSTLILRGRLGCFPVDLRLFRAGLLLLPPPRP